ncbi:MAG: histidine phosphatase family protein [Coprococcus sp.]
MVVYFIRHGETDFNKQGLIQGRTDIPLNETGLSQAEMTAAYFRKEGAVFDRVYSSPLIRAHKTASIVSGWDMADIRTDERVQELAFGTAEGMDFKNLPENIMNLFTKPEAYVPPEGAEQLSALKDRCQSFLDELAAMSLREPSVHTVLVATHGAALRGILSCLDRCPLEKFWKKGLYNCCVVKAQWKDGGWFLEGIENPLRED